MGALAFSVALFAQDRNVVEPDGTRIATRTVHLLQGVPSECVSLEDHGQAATIVLPRDELERLAARNEKADDGKLDRMEFLASGRARDFLKMLGRARDGYGCIAFTGKLPQDSTYLIGWMLEQGKAAVFTKRLRLPEPVIVVRHTDTRLFGYEDFLLLDGTPIWSYGTWVT
ncbi:MAG TPA: hypothetical protein VGC19_05025 [Rhodanobacter sp.]